MENTLQQSPSSAAPQPLQRRYSPWAIVSLSIAALTIPVFWPWILNLGLSLSKDDTSMIQSWLLGADIAALVLGIIALIHCKRRNRKGSSFAIIAIVLAILFGVFNFYFWLFSILATG